MKKSTKKRAPAKKAPATETPPVDPPASDDPPKEPTPKAQSAKSTKVKCLRNFRYRGKLYVRGVIYENLPASVANRFPERFGNPAQDS